MLAVADFIQQLVDNSWQIASGGVAMIAFAAGFRMRLLWAIFTVGLAGAVASIALSNHGPDANARAWHWYAMPFVLLCIGAGLHRHSPLIPLWVAVAGAVLWTVSFVVETPDALPSWYLLLFPLVTTAVAFALYGICRFAGPFGADCAPKSE